MKWQYAVRTRDGAGKLHLSEGDVAADGLDEAIELSRRAAFLELTGGRATFGRPGVDGCRGPYKIVGLILELTGE